MNHLLAKLESHPRNRNEEAMRLKMNPATKLTIRHINRRKGPQIAVGKGNVTNGLTKAQRPLPATS